MVEQEFTKFAFNFLILLATLGGGALALWTWQKRYWEYQLRRQTDDWKLRQSYSRKDARRQAMEGLLTELNEAMERHLIATFQTTSAMIRRDDHKQMYPDDNAGLGSWHEMVNEQVAAFNESEREWLVQSAVLEGKLRLHFAGTEPQLLQAWPVLSGSILNFCTLLNENKARGLHGLIVQIRKQKDELLQLLQREIDRFTTTELELAPVAPTPLPSLPETIEKTPNAESN
ncbi:MAG: hypothetical protein L0241_19960 [Planctomycetia bacterium]|nr:hypothetical protein [Planctomycetia bacterium]